jgi:hypothetical protein
MLARDSEEAKAIVMAVSLSSTRLILETVI